MPNDQRMAIQLVSAKECPFVQRAVIILREKNVAHDVTYIDLSNKPEWFLKQSPRGKVPILIVDDAVLFESQAICEYLDETQGSTHLAPSDPILRARDRAWFAYAGEDFFVPQYLLMIADNANTYTEKRDQIAARLTRLEQELQQTWLSGDGSKFGLADAALAPFFTRLNVLTQWTGYDWLATLPRTKAYSDAVLARPAVRDSVVEDFEPLLQQMARNRNAFVATLIKPS
jgi:glutathione S-transferase